MNMVELRKNYKSNTSLIFEIIIGIAAWVAIYYYYPLELAIPIYANY